MHEGVPIERIRIAVYRVPNRIEGSDDTLNGTPRRSLLFMQQHACLEKDRARGDREQGGRQSGQMRSASRWGVLHHALSVGGDPPENSFAVCFTSASAAMAVLSFCRLSMSKRDTTPCEQLWQRRCGLAEVLRLGPGGPSPRPRYVPPPRQCCVFRRFGVWCFL
jgi:hypothetical protein